MEDFDLDNLQIQTSAFYMFVHEMSRLLIQIPILIHNF